MIKENKRTIEGKDLAIAALATLVLLMAAVILILSMSLYFKGKSDARIPTEITFLEEPLKDDRMGDRYVT